MLNSYYHATLLCDVARMYEKMPFDRKSYEKTGENGTFFAHFKAFQWLEYRGLGRPYAPISGYGLIHPFKVLSQTIEKNLRSDRVSKIHTLRRDPYSK